MRNRIMVKIGKVIFWPFLGNKSFIITLEQAKVIMQLKIQMIETIFSILSRKPKTLNFFNTKYSGYWYKCIKVGPNTEIIIKRIITLARQSSNL